MQENNSRVTLLQYVESKFDALEKLWSAEIKANAEARDLALKVLNARLEHMNQFREENKDLQATKMSKVDCEQHRVNFEKELRPLREYQIELKGKASQRTANNLLVISLINLALFGVSLIMMALFR